MILPIKKYPNPVLRKKASFCKKIDERIKRIASDMIDTLTATNALGLAGNQVGILKRIVVIRIKEEPFVIINPRVISSDGICEASEGCLSFPSLFLNIKRAVNVTFKGLNINGDEIKGSLSGLSARAILHEIDHLDGILFIDKIEPLEKKRVLATLRKIKAT